VDNTISSIYPKIENRNLKFAMEIPDDLPSIKVNKDALTRILINLLDNAIKYTWDQGTIGIRAILLDKEIKIEVWDTGIGIPQADLPRIFERFYRVDKARTRSLGGTGLGLAIVKHLVEAHYGKIGVSSTLDKGSTFWFTLPLTEDDNLVDILGGKSNGYRS
jgi:two-component system phosphate regulon sensor histidine kinase PhoR